MNQHTAILLTKKLNPHNFLDLSCPEGNIKRYLPKIILNQKQIKQILE